MRLADLFHTLCAFKYTMSIHCVQTTADTSSQVLEYLNKKGYSKTEATLRRESAHHDDNGRPLVKRAEDSGGKQYEKAYGIRILFRMLDQALTPKSSTPHVRGG